MTWLGERIVTARDGRALAIAEWGVPDGTPVINLHGTPGSRLGRHPDETMFDRLNMHMVTYDRPGYGNSDRHRGRAVVDAVADVTAIADAMGFERFIVGGGSGGSPHALACAARLPDRVLSAFALVPVAPVEALGDHWMDGQAPSNVEEIAAARAGEDALAAYINQVIEDMRGDAMKVLDLDADLTASDREVMSREGPLRVMREMLAESVRTGPYGWLDDDYAFLKYWGFDVSEIRVPVLIAYAINDTLAPRMHGDWLAGAVPGATVVQMDSGHLSAMEHAESNWTKVLELASTSRS